MKGRHLALLAQIDAAQLDPDLMVIAPLGGLCEPGSEADRSCDRCGTHVPEGRLWLLASRLRYNVFSTGGLCGSCYRLEVGQ